MNYIKAIADYKAEVSRQKTVNRINQMIGNNVFFIEDDPDILLIDIKDIGRIFKLGLNASRNMVDRIKELTKTGYYPIYSYREQINKDLITKKYVAKYVAYHYFIFQHALDNQWVDQDSIPPYDPTEIRNALKGPSEFLSIISNLS